MILRVTIITSLLLSSIYAKSLEGTTISKIPEASGIDYCQDSGTLVVANDEGKYYEIDTKGKILKMKNLGNHDLEGVVCLKKSYIFAVEDRGLLIVDRKTGTKKSVALNTMLDGKRVKLTDKKRGIEGIAKDGNRLYLAKQSKKKKKSLVGVFKYSPFPPSLKSIIKPNVADIAGLCYYNKKLYMVSDKKDKILIYNPKNKKITQKIKLPKGAWEGITFDKDGVLYLADDDGRVVKFGRLE